MLTKLKFAALLHELAVEFRKVMPDGDRKRIEATRESRKMSAAELSELLHELAVEYRKAKKRAEEPKPSAPSW